MKKAIRIALGSAVLAGGLAVVGASPANAQVRFEGSFPLPHGRISIGVGDAGFPIGGYVPDGYSVYDNPEYGYGFEYGDQWIPCEQYGTRWVIVASPIFFGHRDYGYGRTYRNDRSSYSRDYRRYDNRSYNTRAYGSRSYDTRSGDSRSYDNRNSGRDDHQVRDNRNSQWHNRSSQRDNQGSRDQSRRSRW
jgi:hypothetical protein